MYIPKQYTVMVCQHYYGKLTRCSLLSVGFLAFSTGGWYSYRLGPVHSLNHNEGCFLNNMRTRLCYSVPVRVMHKRDKFL